MLPLIVVTLNPSWCNIIKNDIHSFPLEDFRRACEKLSSDLETRCAGLLEVFFFTGCVADAVSVHRSAKEFLKTSPERHAILSLDRRKVEECRYALATAEILIWKLCVYHSLNPWFTHIRMSEPNDFCLLW